MNVSDTLRSTINAIETEAASNYKASKEAETNFAKTTIEIVTVTATMGFWDKNFFGWFGDKQKIQHRRDLRALAEKFNASAIDLAEKAEAAPARVDAAIDSYLDRSDENYQLLKKPYEAAREMNSAVSTFMGKIDNALSEIDDAEGMETLDLVSSNSGISLLSSMENGEASDAINDIKRAVPAFERAVKKYQAANDSFKSDHVRLSNIDDTLDLVTDLAFDGFDFMSIFTLSALSDAEDSVRNLRGKVEPLERMVSTALNHADKAMTDYRQKVYQTVKTGAPA